MSYCRWSEGDVYMYYHVDGYIDCCACSLQPLVPTIMTTGWDMFTDEQLKDPCALCKGAFMDDHSIQCPACGMCGSLKIGSFPAALEHLHVHRAAGHSVPERAFEMIQQDIDDGTVLEPYCAEVEEVEDAEDHSTTP